MPKQVLLVVLGIIALGALLPAPGVTVLAQEAETGAPTVPTREEVEARRAQIDDAIAKLGPASAERKARLERLERLLSQSVDALQRQAELEQELALMRKRADRPLAETFDAQPPFGLRAWDEAVSALDEAERVLERSRTAAKSAVTSLERARARVEERTRDASVPPELAQLDEEADRVTLQLRRIQAASARDAAEIATLDLDYKREVRDFVADRIEPNEAEVAKLSDALQEQIARLSRERAEAEREADAAVARWEAVQRRVAGVPRDTDLDGEVGARRAELAWRHKRVAHLAEQLDRLERRAELVQRRARAFGTPEPPNAELEAWYEEGRTNAAGLEREIRLDRAEADALAQELRAFEELPAARNPRSWQGRQAAAMRETVASYEGNLASLREAVQAERRLVAATELQLGRVDWWERVQEYAAQAADVWSYEVTTSEDRSITVGKLVLALLTFVLGLLLARWVTAWFGNRVFPRMGMDDGAAHAAQSLAYYLLLGIVFLAALRVVNIPLTVFAVLGGALAIGLGFGSQNIVNNFISGLILLAERPIKRGDLVDVEGTYGNIESIGLRSTSVRTGENIHVIVPNSLFLETKVTNWTHNNPEVRIKVTVGVIYGSPTRRVEELIRQALDEHKKVLKTPEPIILFKNFGDNSLDFEAHFWARIRSMMERNRIESDLRFRIDDLFREEGLVIAFPQRDVHLDTMSPLEVRVLGPGTEHEDGA